VNNNLTTTHCWLTDINPILYPAKLAVIGIVFFIATTVLLAWSSPSVAAILPSDWYTMQPTTALPLILLAYSLLLKVAKLPNHTQRIQQLLLLAATIIICTTFYEHLTDNTALIGEYLAASTHLPKVHPTSIQSAFCLLLITLLLSIDEKSHGLLGYIYCTLLFLLFTLTLTFFASYLFGAFNLIALNSYIIISKHSLACIILLGFIISLTHAPYSAYAVLFSTSLGGKFARQFLAVSVISVLMLTTLEAFLMGVEGYELPDINAIILTADVMVLFFIVITASRKIEQQAEQLEELVITDKLTSTLNLRGLNLHATQKLLDARRYQSPLCVLVFDIDDLKQVNDSLGHEIGSALIKDFATALKNNFRSNDIVARTGGDEFVVVSLAKLSLIETTLTRLNQVIFEKNKFAKHPYHISYSVGVAQLQSSSTETINDLLKIADERMYANKQQKKAEAGKE